MVRAGSGIAAITVFTGSGIFIRVNIMAKNPVYSKYGTPIIKSLSTWTNFFTKKKITDRIDLINDAKLEWMSFPVKRSV